MRIRWDASRRTCVGNRLVIDFESGDAALVEQAEVFLYALQKYAERNEEYRDNWRRMGWRGMLVRIRERSERLWDSLFWTQLPEKDYTAWSNKKLDDAIDLINFAGFLVRAVRAGNRDGTWWSR